MEAQDIIIDIYARSQSTLDETDLHTALDSYTNKEDWKGITSTQEQNIIDTNLRTQTLETEISNIKSTVNSLPTLLDIEQSAILAKKADISIVEAIVNTLPGLLEIRDEMVNVSFGGLEIANNQMTIKDKAGVVIAIFDLFDKNGNPTMGAVYKREIIV